MTVEAVREKPARKPRRPRRVEPPIAELELAIFDCPACGRPRSAEADPCPDCSTQPSTMALAVASKPVEAVESVSSVEPVEPVEPVALVEPDPEPGPEPDHGHPDRPAEFRSAVVEAAPEPQAWSPPRPRRVQLPIGEPDANIFGCPACARPLSVGTARCPDCSTRLIAGVRASRAVTFVGAGLLVGVLIGGSVVGAFALVGRPAEAAAVGAAASTPSSAPAASAPGGVPPAASAPGGVPLAASTPATSAPIASLPAPSANPGVPASALSALRQSLLVNQRLATDAAKLSAAMTATRPASVEIARALRLLAADAAFGDRIAPDVAAWSDAAGVSAELVDAYAAIGATARAGLASSLGNTRAYLKAGQAMQQVMADLAEIDGAARALGSSAGLDLPPSAPAAD